MDLNSVAVKVAEKISTDKFIQSSCNIIRKSIRADNNWSELEHKVKSLKTRLNSRIGRYWTSMRNSMHNNTIQA